MEGTPLQVRATRLLLPLRLGRLSQSQSAVQVGQRVEPGQFLSTPLGTGARPLPSPVHGRVSALPVTPVTLPGGAGRLVGPLPLPCVELRELSFPEAPAAEAWRQLEGPALRERVNVQGLEGEEGLALDLELELLPKGARLVVLAQSPAPALDSALLEHEGARLSSAVAALCRLRSFGEALILHAPVDRESASRLAARLESLLPARLQAVGGGHAWTHARLALCAAGLPYASARRTLATQGYLVCSLTRLLLVEEELRCGAPGPFPLQIQAWRGTRHLPEADGPPRLVELWPGTPLGELLSALGRDPSQEDELVLDGSPLEGTPLLDPAQPLLPGLRLISLIPRSSLPHAAEGPCISCGQCLDICPVHLTPVRLARLVEEGRVTDACRLGLEDCVDCGLCSWTCPSRLELGHSLRKGLHQVWEGRHGA